MNEEIKEILDRLFVYKNENDEMKYQPEDILTIDDVWLLYDYITNLQEENKQLTNARYSLDKVELEDRLDTLKIEISSLMSRYFYEEDFYIEDTHLDKLLRIIDGDNILEGSDKDE